MKQIFLSIFLFVSFYSLAQKSNDDKVFKEIYASIEDYNYFKAKDIYDERKNELSPFHQTLTEAYLDNCFNRLILSEKNIQTLKEKYTTQFNQLPDSVHAEIYSLEESNDVKLYDYKEAAKIADTILSHPSFISGDEDSVSARTASILYNAIKDVPEQTINICNSDSIDITKDIVGLNNLKVNNGKDTSNFVFDTGSPFSSVSESTAKKFGMKIFDDSINVGNLFGKYTKARIAVCDELKLGSIDIKNVIFLLYEDSDLAFPQVTYQINGILGFTVIEALKEIQITQSGKFIVPKQTSAWNSKSNLAFNDLHPYILVDNNPYIFDTGSSETVLFKKYYDDYKSEIEKNYKDTTFILGSIGSATALKGYLIDFSPSINGKKLALRNIQVNTSASVKGLYGQIGQDVIRSFSKMTINFDKMFIKFE